MSILERIREYIADCPYLTDSCIYIDFLDDKLYGYMLEGVPVSEVVRRYADGGSIRRYEFVFGARLPYGTEQTALNHQFYQQFSEWLEEQMEKGKLPDLGKGKIPHSIKALSHGYLLDGDGNCARYQIQCELEYYQD
ncbi:MAG: chloramphenicol resistance protein [Ruminococcaceae bacterium]|nr:chloramphenicol resistance protein [Oscillospiraceae bacterium]